MVAYLHSKTMPTEYPKITTSGSLQNWFLNRNPKLSLEKSSATIFTSWTKKAWTELDVKVGNHSLPTASNPKIPSVTFYQIDPENNKPIMNYDGSHLVATNILHELFKLKYFRLQCMDRRDPFSRSPHFHVESNILPVKQHSNMLSKQ